MVEKKTSKSKPAAKSAAPKAASKKVEAHSAAPAAPKPKKEKAPKPAASPSTDPRASMNPLQKRRVLVGTVVSDKMQKTIVVKIDRQVKHGLYGKYIAKSRRFQVHDENNTAKVGDLVQMIESRPLSRSKRWALQSIVRKAVQVVEMRDEAQTV
ncbi:30S ribosomal protein S17 [bacterium]|jgi:small subunit ribosomal protein S17|nr:30S ribosomal protein S17 [bacterium]